MPIEAFTYQLGGDNEVCFLMEKENGQWCTEHGSTSYRNGAKVWNLEIIGVQEEWSRPKIFHILPPIEQPAVVEPIPAPPEGVEESSGQIIYRLLASGARPAAAEPRKELAKRVQYLTDKAKELLSSPNVLHRLPILAAIERQYFSNGLLIGPLEWGQWWNGYSAILTRYQASQRQSTNPVNARIKEQVNRHISPGSDWEEEVPR